ncbi:hypothetical protein [Candidatus Clostridium stratigraminis]|uniref:Uncharacterized protein n=1 Tax=Candidatus Clostridium stratigraminis TaxID=3381661 RepID=A0ABW8T4G9_9CLOT
MRNNNLKGIAMNTRDLKDIVNFFSSKGISPTVKELCGNKLACLVLQQYYSRNLAS